LVLIIDVKFFTISVYNFFILCRTSVALSSFGWHWLRLFIIYVTSQQPSGLLLRQHSNVNKIRQTTMNKRKHRQQR